MKKAVSKEAGFVALDRDSSLDWLEATGSIQLGSFGVVGQGLTTHLAYTLLNKPYTANWPVQQTTNQGLETTRQTAVNNYLVIAVFQRPSGQKEHLGLLSLRISLFLHWDWQLHKGYTLSLQQPY